ncbi:hypothetical protein [Pasteurella bettyae]|uniref:hypothetical protein n=1 Tax=Pasteurella bettyae TaxID=752 RepID=UPI003D2E4D42
MEIIILLTSIIALPILLLVACAIMLTSSVMSISSVIAPSVIGGIMLLFALGLIAYPFRHWISQHEKTLDKWGNCIGITLFLLCLAYHWFYVW